MVVTPTLQMRAFEQFNPNGNGATTSNRPEVVEHFNPSPCTDRLVMSDFSKKGKWTPEHETAPPRERLIDTLVSLNCTNPERGIEPKAPTYVLRTTDKRPDRVNYFHKEKVLVAKRTKRGDRYHWHASRCIHAISPNEYTADRVFSDKDFANAFVDERCQTCHAQYVQRK